MFYLIHCNCLKVNIYTLDIVKFILQICIAYLTWGIITGTLPTDGRVVHGKACKVKGKSHPCDTEYPISIKKCVNFMVYFLGPTKTCAEAYCFGKFIIFESYYLNEFWSFSCLTCLCFINCTPIESLSKWLNCWWLNIFESLKLLWNLILSPM